MNGPAARCSIMAKDDEKLPRRAFFKEGLRRMLRPLADSLEPVENAVRRLSELAEQAKAQATAQRAVEEQTERQAGGPDPNARPNPSIAPANNPSAKPDTATPSLDALPAEHAMIPTSGLSADHSHPSTFGAQGQKSSSGVEASVVGTTVSSAPPATQTIYPPAQVAPRPPVIGSIARSAGGRRQHWIRPPGAMKEGPFRLACTQCGECVKACPANAIQLDLTGQRGEGLPFIVPGEMPCVVCEGLHCMHVCPSGALSLVEMTDIHMGTAIWKKDHCLRPKGEDCTACVEVCPLGDRAIEVTGRVIEIHESGCIGCGLCESRCPTGPKSIVIEPASVLG